MERVNNTEAVSSISGETIEIDARPGFQGSRNFVCGTHALLGKTWDTRNRASTRKSLSIRSHFRRFDLNTGFPFSG